jgi:MoaD family protein
VARNEGLGMHSKRIRLRFLSTMKELVEKNYESLEVDAHATVEDLLRELSMRYNNSVVNLVFQEDKKSIRNDILILVNDVDISALDGLETLLSENDEVALIPVAHGG